MGIISAIIIGLIVGAIAKFLMPGKDPGGWIITILIGLAGSLIGTYLGQVVGLYRAGATRVKRHLLSMTKAGRCGLIDSFAFRRASLKRPSTAELQQTFSPLFRLVPGCRKL
jgi:uncharacterized membrane protein YeaQ/YmgE (transglycosylase-associated protein family)